MWGVVEKFHHAPPYHLLIIRRPCQLGLAGAGDAGWQDRKTTTVRQGEPPADSRLRRLNGDRRDPAAPVEIPGWAERAELRWHPAVWYNENASWQEAGDIARLYEGNLSIKVQS
jgi:hypothetical protein